MKNEIKETEKEAYIVISSFSTTNAWPQTTSAALSPICSPGGDLRDSRGAERHQV